MWIALGILLIGILIIFHELGHFLFARLFGVRVLRFSIGFGPIVYSKKIGVTEYAVSLVPLGGYVKMWGEDDSMDEKLLKEGANPSEQYSSKAIWKRFLILFAGPGFNLLSASLFFILAYGIYGIPVVTNTVGTVLSGSPAERAGIVVGDAITEIRTENGSFDTPNWENITAQILSSNGAELLFSVRGTDGKERALRVQPKKMESVNQFGQTVMRYAVGITPTPPMFRQDLPEALVLGIRDTWKVTSLTAQAFWKLVAGELSAQKALGGPIQIVSIMNQAGKDGGVREIMIISALLSINLFILNLLPVPVLDGGHILFLLIEKIRGKPVPNETQNIALNIGLYLLIVLAIFATYNDLSKVFGF